MKLAAQIKILKRDKTVSGVVEKRIKEFKEIHKRDNSIWFRELCFCLLTANFKAEESMKICEKECETGAFTKCLQGELSEFLKKHGHRFPNARAGFITGARKYKNEIKNIVVNFKDEREAREWLAKNIKGLGYKEASHFLRNVGYENVAIIDRHILKVLYENKIIPEIPKTIGKRKYLEIEKELEKIAGELNINLSELDFYLWYMKTGKVLK